MSELHLQRGGCHCGRVRFTVRAAVPLEAVRCNCTICTLSAYLHLIVPAADIRLESGAESLTTYTFNTGVARHYFCRHCGVKSFYVPRSNPDGFSVNVRCLDSAGIESVRVTDFDGQHWEHSAASLRHLSRPEGETAPTDGS